MKNQVLENYEVNKNTMALLSVAHLDYDTIALEPSCELYIRKTPFQLIKMACLEGGSSYEGRRAAVAHVKGAKHKVPIPINPLEQIYAFPTHSPKEFECSWIFYTHIRSITACTLPNMSNGTMLTFKNLNQLELPVSYYTIEKQVQRTSYCMTRFSRSMFEIAKFNSHFSTDLSY